MAHPETHTPMDTPLVGAGAYRPLGEGGRPRVLFLSQTLPYPADGGVNIRTHHVLRMLAGAFDVTALCFYRRRERPTAAAVAESVAALSRFCHVEAFPIPQEHNSLRFVRDHLLGTVRRRAYTLQAYESRSYARRLRDLLAETRFDLVHLDSIDLAGYLPRVPEVPVVCVHHNVESQLLRRRAAHEQSSWRRRYVALQADFTERLERTVCPRFALNVSVSPEDAKELRRLVPDAPIATVPNGVDTTAFSPSATRGNGLVCVGGINGFANRDGLDYLCDAILPQLRALRVNTPVRWVGRAEPADQRRYRQTHDVELTGYVDDVRPYVHKARCFVVPLRVGGGTRVKILDAWAMGMPVVSTSLGCEGLATVHGKNILIADTPGAFAEAVNAVLHDDMLAARLSANARHTAVKHYSWTGVGERMISMYRELIDKPQRATAG